MVIAIDGTASSGKSSAALKLAKKLGVPLLNTGAVYRALTYLALSRSIAVDEEKELSKVLSESEIKLVNREGEFVAVIDKIPVSHDALYSEEVSVAVPHYSKKSFVREFVRNLQRSVSEENETVVVEGRDIGSVVFPDADFKFFIDADLKTRARRRHADYQRMGNKISLAEVEKELSSRDEEDKFRQISPLILASDATLIDSSNISVSEVVDEMFSRITNKS